MIEQVVRTVNTILKYIVLSFVLLFILKNVLEYVGVHTTTEPMDYAVFVIKCITLIIALHIGDKIMKRNG